MTEKNNKKQNKYVTMSAFEKSMVSIANSFAKIDERFDRHEIVFEKILGEIQTIHIESREHRLTMATLAYTDTHHERSIDDLQDRVCKLETKSA